MNLQGISFLPSFVIHCRAKFVSVQTEASTEIHGVPPPQPFDPFDPFAAPPVYSQPDPQAVAPNTEIQFPFQVQEGIPIIQEGISIPQEKKPEGTDDQSKTNSIPVVQSNFPESQAPTQSPQPADPAKQATAPAPLLTQFPHVPKHLLPSGWDVKLDPQGRPYYIDHNTRITTYQPPVPLPQFTVPSYLPPGWESRPNTFACSDDYSEIGPTGQTLLH